MNEADPRVKRTRKLLLDAFAALLGEQRFSDISVQDIAERAMVNRATFYAHFEDKYALLDEAVGEHVRATVTSRHSPTAPFTVENLAELIEAVMQSRAQFHDHCQHQAPGKDISPMLEAKVQQQLNAHLLEWLRASPPLAAQPEAPLETIAAVMSWAIFGAASEWSRGDRRHSADERARQVAAMLLGGVAGRAREPVGTASVQA